MKTTTLYEYSIEEKKEEDEKKNEDNHDKNWIYNSASSLNKHNKGYKDHKFNSSGWRKDRNIDFNKDDRRYHNNRSKNQQRNRSKSHSRSRSKSKSKQKRHDYYNKHSMTKVDDIYKENKDSDHLITYRPNSSDYIHSNALD